MCVCIFGYIGCYVWIWVVYLLGQEYDIWEVVVVFYYCFGIVVVDFFDGDICVFYYVVCVVGLKMAGYVISFIYYKKIIYFIEIYEFWCFDFVLFKVFE